MNQQLSHDYFDVNILKTEEYNRKLLDTQNHAKNIAVNFDPKRIGTPELSYRDGNYYIVDGQNRILACRLVNHNPVYCKIHYGLTIEEEAMLFYDLNSHRFPLKASEKLNGLRVAQDAETMRIYGVVGMNGCQISTGCGPKKISAIGALLNVSRKFGINVLDGALQIDVNSWHGDPCSLKGDMIEGLAVLIKTYGTDFKKQRAIDKFSGISPNDVFKLASQDPMGGMKKFRMARALLYFYNHSAKQKLDASLIK